MTNPRYSYLFTDEHGNPTVMDPSEVELWEVDFQALESETGLPPALAEGETITNIVACTPTAEAASLGFEVMSDPAPFLGSGSTRLRFWTRVDETRQGDPAWDGYGTRCGVEVIVETSDAPRQLALTVLIQVGQS